MVRLAQLLIIITALYFGSTVFAKEGKPKDIHSELKMVAGDERGNEVKALKTELLVERSEKKALQQIKYLIKKYRGKSIEAEMWFRLAELHMRRAKTERFFEIHRQSDTVTSLIPKRVRKASQSKEIRSAIKVYEKIRKRFRKFAKYDLVLFNNAFARQQLGHNKMAEKIYWEIVKRFPNSILVPDAHLAIGEINYDRRNFKFALQHFQMIEKFPNSRVYPYGLYKAAWCQYNLNDAVAAMGQLEKVVKYGQYITKNKLDSRLDLRKEALRDMSLFYGEVYEAKDAVSYFKKQAAELDMSPYVLRLVSLYRRHSRFKDVENVLHNLIKEVPDSEKIPDAYQMLVMNYEEMREREKAVAQLDRFSKYCIDLDPKNAKEKIIGEICQNKISSTSKNLAAKWHRMWKKNQTFPVFASSAEASYKVYIKHNLQTNPELAPVRGSYADLLFQMNRFRDASEQYALVKLAKPEKKLDHDTAYAAIVSLEKAVKDEWSDKDEELFITLGNYYVKQFPKGKYSLDIRFKKALIAYRKGRYDEASPDLKMIGRSYPKTEKGQSAQDLYLDILNLKKNYTELKKESSALLKLTANSDRKRKIKKIYQEAYFSEVQVIEDSKDTEKAVQGYIQFAKENSSSPLAPKSWGNAIRLLFASEQIMRGSEVCLSYSKSFPNEATAKQCLMQSASELEQIGELKESIKVINVLVNLDSAQSRKWLELKADFQQLLGRSQSALRIYKNLSSIKDKGESGRILAKMARIYKSNGNKVAYKALRTEVMNLGVEPDASIYLSEVVAELFYKKQYSKAFTMSKKLVSRSVGTVETRSKARFIQAQILQDEFVRQSVKARIDRIALVLAIKTEKLEKAQKAYQAVISYGHPEYMVRSLEKLSEMYSIYAKHVRTMKLPKDTPEDEKRIFQAEIERLVIPMEEKGVDTLLEALKAAKTAKLIDGSVARIEQKINKMNMTESDIPNLTVELPGFAGPEFRKAGS